MGGRSGTRSHAAPVRGTSWGRFVLVLVLVLTVASACGDSPPPSEESARPESPLPGELRDSAGIAVATMRLTPEVPHWQVGPGPALVLGEVEGELPYMFSRAEFAGRLSDGRIVVADFGSGELRFFGADGRFLRSVGRKGEGPREFREFNRVVLLPGDTLVVYDRANLRITRVGPEGEFLEDRSIRELYTARMSDRWWLHERPEFRTVGSGPSAQLARWRNLLFAGPLAEGAHAIAFQSPAVPPPAPQVDTMRTAASVVHMGAEGAWVAGAEFRGTLQIPMWIERQPPRGGAVARPAAVPFHAEPLLVARGGPVVVSNTGRYEFQVFGTGGDLLRIIRRDDMDPRPVTPEHIERFVEATVGRPGAMVEWAVRELATTSFERAGAGYTLPTHAAIHLDPAGRLWVEDWRFPWDEREPRTFTVFDPDGWIEARATVPAELAITDIGLDHVTGVMWDGSGVETVHVLEIRR